MRSLILLTLLTTLAACGGGGSSDNSTGATPICQRTDVNSRVFCALQQDYLWYRDLPASINPDNYSSPSALLQAVVAPQDRYSFILTRQEYEDRFINATFFGYGFSSVRADNNTALQIAYVYDDGSAAQNGLRRGDKIIEIEGVSVASWLSQLDAGQITSNDIYGPNQAGVVRNFVWLKPDGTVQNSACAKRILYCAIQYKILTLLKVKSQPTPFCTARLAYRVLSASVIWCLTPLSNCQKLSLIRPLFTLLLKV